MAQKVLYVFVTLVTSFCITFLTASIYAEEPKAQSVEEQLTAIAASQKTIEQRLATIEAKQMTILYSLQALGGKNIPGPAQAMPPAQDSNKVYNIGVGSSPVKGNKNAKVTIVEFSDFQCPYSQKFHPVVGEVMKTYPKDVNFVFKNFPLSFHPQARPAAKAALAAGEQGKYWEMVEALFQNGRELSDAKFEELAKQLGLNAEKFIKDYKDNDAKWEKLIGEDMAVAGQSGVQGTPTFFINGKKTNARDLAAYKQEIDQILQGAQEGAKKGK